MDSPAQARPDRGSDRGRAVGENRTRTRGAPDRAGAGTGVAVLGAFCAGSGFEAGARRREAGDRRPPSRPRPSSGPFKDAFLAEIRKNKVAFYNMVVAQARTIDIGADRIEFTFSANQRALREQVEQNKAWLESMALQAGGRRFTVVATQDSSTAPSSEPRASSPEPRATSPESPSPELRVRQERPR